MQFLKILLCKFQIIFTRLTKLKLQFYTTDMRTYKLHAIVKNLLSIKCQ